MNRRTTLAALVLFGVAPLSVPARATQKVYRIGVLSLVVSRARITTLLTTHLRDLGYEEGRNIEFDFRHAEGREDKLPSLAAELVARNVDLILAMNNPETEAAKRATSTIPIVMAYTIAPVETGLVASLARPGGNVTGTTIQSPETAGKMVEVLRDAVPRAKQITSIFEPGSPGLDQYRRATERAASAMGLALKQIPVRDISELNDALSLVARERPDALIAVTTGPIFFQRALIIDFAAKQRLPVLYTAPQPVLEGGLIAYTADFGALSRRTVAIMDRIFKGDKPSDIPVEQPTRFELSINLKAAMALPFAIPKSLLLRADRVIE